MEAAKIREIVVLHGKWRLGQPGGRKADFRGADLQQAELRWVELTDADLQGANLARADLTF
ncbi:MAG: pentapeptide repeat-containing protein, partial [Halobacteriota archaeon]